MGVGSSDGLGIAHWNSHKVLVRAQDDGLGVAVAEADRVDDADADGGFEADADGVVEADADGGVDGAVDVDAEAPVVVVEPPGFPVVVVELPVPVVEVVVEERHTAQVVALAMLDVDVV